MAEIIYTIKKDTFNAEDNTVKVEATAKYSESYGSTGQLYIARCNSNKVIQEQVLFNPMGSAKSFTVTFGTTVNDEGDKTEPFSIGTTYYIGSFLYKNWVLSDSIYQQVKVTLPSPSISISLNKATVDGAVLDIGTLNESTANSNGYLYFTTAYSDKVVQGDLMYYASCAASEDSITITKLSSDTDYDFYVYIYDGDWDAYFRVDSISFTTKASTCTARAYRTGYTSAISSVTPSSSVTVDVGDTQKFYADVNYQYIFSGWYSTSSTSTRESLDNPYFLEINENTTLYARAESTSLSFSNITKTSFKVKLTTAYNYNGTYDYKINVYKITNSGSTAILNGKEITYADVAEGYLVSGLEEGTTYAVNIAYKAGSDADFEWIWQSGTAPEVETKADVRYRVSIKYANGIQSGQFWGSNIKDPDMALEGSSVSFSATAKSNYVFYGWYDEDENFLSDANPYTISSVQKDTVLIAKAIPVTDFLVSYESIDIQTIGSVTEEAKVYHDSKLLETIDPESSDMFPVSAKVYPSSTYTIKITYNCDFSAAGATINYESITETYQVTTLTPKLTALVNGNQVTVSLNAGYGTGWSVYFSSPFEEDTFADLSTSSSKAIFTYLKYNTKYEFYCNYRVASGSSYTTKTLGVSATTPNTSPTYSVACYKDDNTVASFGKSPNTTFKYRDEVTVTAVALSNNYQYDYTTPKIYEGTSSSGDLVSSSGSYTHIVIKNISFYAQGTRTKREYEADIEATYVSDTSQKITITNLSSTSGLNSYYYITENTSNTPVTSLSSAKSFARSTGYITLTNLSSGKHTYYCYVYNSTYGYYYLIGSVTFISGAQVELWEWTPTERAAFTGKGKFNILTASRWIAFCERFNEVVDAKSYASSLKITVPDVVSGDILTAEDFNHVTNQIAWLGHAYFNQDDFYEGRTIVSRGDPVKGKYFIELETALNNLINAL